MVVILFDEPDSALQSAESIVLFLYAHLLLGLTQEEHATHLLGCNLLFQALCNLLKRETEILESENAMEPRKLEAE
jgi:hypothetical protein